MAAQRLARINTGLDQQSTFDPIKGAAFGQQYTAHSHPAQKRRREKALTRVGSRPRQPRHTRRSRATAGQSQSKIPSYIERIAPRRARSPSGRDRASRRTSMVSFSAGQLHWALQDGRVGVLAQKARGPFCTAMPPGAELAQGTPTPSIGADPRSNDLIRRRASISSMRY